MHDISLKTNKFSRNTFLFFTSCLIAVSGLSMRLSLICLLFFLPTIIAIMKDRSNDQCLSLSVGLCNISGIITYLPELFVFYMQNASDSFIHSLPRISDIALVYSFSCIGLVIYVSLPSLIAFVYLTSFKSKRSRLNRQIALQKQKWDL
jgi:hypothetical protein